MRHCGMWHRLMSRSSGAALHKQAGPAQGFSQLCFNSHRLAPGNVLQVQRRPVRTSRPRFSTLPEARMPALC